MQPSIQTLTISFVWALNILILVVIASVKGYCPKPCSCRDSDGATEINCESRNLKHVPVLSRDPNELVSGILLGHNKITTIYSNTFGGVQAKFIYLTGNPLSIIAHDAFSHIRQLHLLSLEDCGLNEVVFYPKFTASTQKYYLTMNRNNIAKVAEDFVGEVVRRSTASGKKFHIELERNQLKSLDFLGDVCEVREAHVVNIYVKENPLICDCNLHALLYKVGDKLKIHGRCSNPRQYRNDPINVFMEKARIQCNRTCFTDDVQYDCDLGSWSYHTNKTCQTLPICKNGAVMCYVPVAGSVRTASQSGASPGPNLAPFTILMLAVLLWTHSF